MFPNIAGLLHQVRGDDYGVAGASGIIVAHNHPSGDARPSQSDIEVTRRLADASQALGICLHDHLVVAGGEVRSAMFAD